MMRASCVVVWGALLFGQTTTKKRRRAQHRGLMNCSAKQASLIAQGRSTCNRNRSSFRSIGGPEVCRCAAEAGGSGSQHFGSPASDGSEKQGENANAVLKQGLGLAVELHFERTGRNHQTDGGLDRGV